MQHFSVSKNPESVILGNGKANAQRESHGKSIELPYSMCYEVPLPCYEGGCTISMSRITDPDM